MVVERSDGRFQTSTLPARALLATLRAGEAVEFVARGSSMWPRVRSGATLRIQPCPPFALRVGDLGAFERGGQLVVHRVRQVGRHGVRFAGDALAQDDGEVSANDVLGRAEILRQPALRLVVPRRRHLVAAVRSLRALTTAFARRWISGAGT